MDDKELHEEIEKLKAAAKGQADVLEMLTKASKDHLKFVLEFTRLKGKTDKDQYEAAISMMKKMRESVKSYEALSKSIKETSQQFKDGSISADQLSSSVKTLRGEIERTTDKQKRAALMHEKSVLEDANFRAQAGKHFANSLGKISTSVGSAMVGAFTGAARSAMSGASGLQVSADLMSAQLSAMNTGVQAGANGLTQFGAATMGAGGRVGKLGIIATAAGGAISFLSNTITDLAKAGIGLMITQTTKMIDGFMTMSAVGAVYAGGMQEMTKTALGAGMTIENFSKAVAENKSNLSKLGLGAVDASKRLSKAMAFGGEEVRRGMFALGLSMEEQAGVYASTMATMAGPTRTLNASNKEVSDAAQEYAKHLKTMSALTGEDMKSKQEKIRQENDNLFMTKYLNSLENGERIKFQAMLDTMNDDDRKALGEMMRYGNVITPALAHAANVVPAIGKKWKEIEGAVKDKTFSGEKGKEIQSKYGDLIAKQGNQNTGGLDIARSGIAVESSSVINSQMTYGASMKPEAIAKVKAEQDEAKRKALEKDSKGNYVDTKGAANLMEITNKFSLTMQTVASDNMPAFATALDETAKSALSAVTALAKLGTSAGSSLSEIFSVQGLLMVASTLIPAILGVVASSKISKALTATSAVTATAPSAGGKVATAAGAGIGSLAKGVGAIGKGIGTGVTGMLAGIASGIASFASPKVLLGGVVIAGLGASLIVAGKGFKEFLGLGWDSLAQAVVGVGAIATVAGVIGTFIVPIGLGAIAIAGLGLSVGILGTALKNFPSGMFTGLTDMFAGMGKALGGLFSSAWGYVSDAVSNAWTVVKSFTSGIIEPFKTSFNWIGSKITEVTSTISNAFTGAFSTVVSSVQWVGSTVVGVWNWIKTGVVAVGSGIANAFTGSINWVSDKITKLGKTFTSIFTSIKELAKDVFSFITDPIKAVFNIIEGAKKLWDKITGKAPAVANTPEEQKEEEVVDDFSDAVVKFSLAVNKFSDIINRINFSGGNGARSGSTIMSNDRSSTTGSGGNAVGGPTADNSTPFTGDKKEFQKKMYDALLKEATAAKVANPEAIARLGVAQTSLETGYGKHLAGGNNYFGIKAKPGEGGSGIDTQEFENGRMVTKKQQFRKYNSMNESAADYIKFLQENKRYKDVLSAKTAEDAITAQGKTGYATDPRYAEKLRSMDSRGIGSTLVAGETGGIPNANLSRINSGVRSMADQRSEQYNNQQTFYNTAAQNKGVMPVELSGAVGADGKRGRDPLTTGFESIKTVMCKVADLQEQSVGHLQAQIGISDAQRSIAQKQLYETT